MTTPTAPPTTNPSIQIACHIYIEFRISPSSNLHRFNVYTTNDFGRATRMLTTCAQGLAQDLGWSLGEMRANNILLDGFTYELTSGTDASKRVILGVIRRTVDSEEAENEMSKTEIIKLMREGGLID